MNAEIARKDFEVWAEANQFCLHRDDSKKYVDYHKTTTRWAWMAWQAGQAAMRERLAVLCEEIGDKHLASGRYASVIADASVRAGGQVDGAYECARSIRDGK